MIVDTSAIMAIALREPDGELMLKSMAGASQLLLSVGSWVELEAVLTRRGNDAMRVLADELLEALRVALRPVTIEHAQLARAAYREYGRGTQHSAALNFGDCFAYALAKETGQPLLFKGNDFNHTDIVSAL